MINTELGNLSQNVCQRERSTSATATRLNNLAWLVKEFRKKELSTIEVEKLFGFSTSGARKYIRDLLNAKVIEFTRYAGSGVNEKKAGSAVFAITKDDGIVAQFLNAIENEKKAPARPSSNPKEALVRDRRYGDRMVQLSSEDRLMSLSRPPQVIVPRRDPLVAALFGSPQNQEVALSAA